MNTGEGVARENVLGRQSQRLIEELFRFRQLHEVSTDHAEADESNNVFRVFVEDDLKLSRSTLELTVVRKSVGQTDPRIEIARHDVDRALVDLCHFAETLLRLQEIDEHFARSGLSRLDRKRLLQQTYRRFGVALTAPHLSEEVHLGVRRRHEADDLLEMLRGLVGPSGRDQQAGETAAALHIAEIEANRLFERVHGELFDFSCRAAAKHRKVGSSENTMCRGDVRIELDSSLRTFKCSLCLSQPIVELGQGDVRIAGLRIELQGPVVVLNGVLDAHLPVSLVPVPLPKAEIVVGLRLGLGGRADFLSRCKSRGRKQPEKNDERGMLHGSLAFIITQG